MERTCLVTKTIADPKDLLRFTIVDGQLVFDSTPSKKGVGRGGYVIAEAEAIEKLPKLSGKIAYFLKVKRVEVSVEAIERGKSKL